MFSILIMKAKGIMEKILAESYVAYAIIITNIDIVIIMRVMLGHL